MTHRYLEQRKWAIKIPIMFQYKQQNNYLVHKLLKIHYLADKPRIKIYPALRIRKILLMIRMKIIIKINQD